MIQIINVGLVAYGKIARGLHAPLICNHPGLNLRTVVQRHSREAEKDYHGVQVVEDIDELLQYSGVQLVVITTPNELHYEHARKALEAGKHVVVEKPFTITHQEALELKKLAEEKNRIISVFQNRRWDGDFITLQRVLQSELVGSPVYFRNHYDRFRPYLKNDENYWREQNVPGAGLTYDLAPHLVDQTLCLFGLPTYLMADIRKTRKKSKVDDFFEITLFYKKLKVSLHASVLSGFQSPHFSLTGTNGKYIKYGQEEHNPYGSQTEELGVGHYQVMMNDLETTGTVTNGREQYHTFYDGIYRAITEGATPEVTPAEACNVMYVIEKAFESSSRGVEKIELTEWIR